MTLTEFLLARIAEDEARRWWVHDGECETWASVDGLPDATFRAHMPQAVCDCPVPARVLAECEAKRRIVEEVVPMVERVESYAVDGGIHYEPESRRHPHQNLLHILALPYADHPDYRDEWKP